MLTLNKNKLGLLAAGLLCWGLPVPSPAAQDRPAAGPEITYNHYQYNYPHQLPADYVFRTSRVFSPLELEQAAAAATRDGSAAADHRVHPEVSGHGVPQAAARDRVTGGELLTDEAIAGLVAELLASGRDELRDGYSLAVSTPVSLHNLYATSSFGRLLGERLLGELQRAGLKVIDVRKSPALQVRERHGEYGLSRDMDELSFVLDAQAVLVGTYTATADRLLVDLRVLRNRDSRVLASARRDFDMSREIGALLADEDFPRATASVPLRGYYETVPRPGPQED